MLIINSYWRYRRVWNGRSFIRVVDRVDGCRECPLDTKTERYFRLCPRL